MIRGFVRRQLRSRGLELRQIPSRLTEGTSLFGEDAILRGLLVDVGDVTPFCVDIGANDGRTMSNSLALFRAGWPGLAVEPDPAAFVSLSEIHAESDAVVLARLVATPDNAAAVLAAADTPREFGVLTIDIDGYDHYVLEAVLAAYRPTLICTEINEKIPPPVRFSVRYAESYKWDMSLFYGQSIAQLDVLRARHDYALVAVEFNNAFLMPAEVAPRALAIDDAYNSGYAARPDRLEKMPWNEPYESLLTMDPPAIVERLRAEFDKKGFPYLLTPS